MLARLTSEQLVEIVAWMALEDEDRKAAEKAAAEKAERERHNVRR